MDITIMLDNVVQIYYTVGAHLSRAVDLDEQDLWNPKPDDLDERTT